jgi:putative membrane-bound dehydrogenase-like protein
MQLSGSRHSLFLLPVITSLLADLVTIPTLAEPPLPEVKRLQTSPVLQHLKPNPMAAPPRTPAEQTVAQMYLPEGFRAELVVGEPDLQQPVAFAFDERGRIWVAEAYSYPQKQPAGQGLDKIVIFEDRDGDGKFESRKVFAEGLNLVSGLEVGYGGVWVGAAPELLFIADRNHDDVPDGPPEVLLDGFGYQDTHECLNSFLWGPDGWLYGNQGVFNYARIGKPGLPDEQRVELRAGVWRYHPVRHEFEVFASGGSNQWGLDYDERGQLFMTH